MAKTKDEYQALSGPQKAAIFMLSLGHKQSGMLVERMDDDEIRELSQAMSGLGAMSSNISSSISIITKGSTISSRSSPMASCWACFCR